MLEPISGISSEKINTDEKEGADSDVQPQTSHSLPQVCVCEEGKIRGWRATAAGAALLKMFALNLFTLRMLLPEGQTLNPPFLNSPVTQ